MGRADPCPGIFPGAQAPPTGPDGGNPSLPRGCSPHTPMFSNRVGGVGRVCLMMSLHLPCSSEARYCPPPMQCPWSPQPRSGLDGSDGPCVLSTHAFTQGGRALWPAGACGSGPPGVCTEPGAPSFQPGALERAQLQKPLLH